jgi:hypothetical protein
LKKFDVHLFPISNVLDICYKKKVQKNNNNNNNNKIKKLERKKISFFMLSKDKKS